jgi:hypothetical protein
VSALTVKVRSFSKFFKKYEVNITERTCTCPDWRERRHWYYPNEPMRLCKHLVREVVKHGMHQLYGAVGKDLVWRAKKGWGYLPPRDETDGAYYKKELSPEGRRELLTQAFGEPVTLADELVVQKAFGVLVEKSVDRLGT